MSVAVGLEGVGRRSWRHKPRLALSARRTDRGDRIRDGEWDHLSEATGSDGKRDDDVDIVLHADGSDPLVEYHQP